MEVIMPRSSRGIFLVISLVVVLAGCAPFEPTQAGPSGPTASGAVPTQPTRAEPSGPTLTAGVSPEPTLCPQATPEWLRVEPVTSPTDQLSQTVTVIMGNLDVVTITAESGVFTGTGSPALVDVTLLPDTVHHLDVVARVKELWQQGCPYGGYTLRTTRDKNGVPLVIEQGQPGPPRPPGAVIGPENALQLALLFFLAPDARLTADFRFRGDEELVSVGYANKISRWSLITGEESGRLGDGLEEAAALCVAVSADRSWIATGGTAQDPSVRLWDVATGEMTLLGRHQSLLTAVAFNPSGTRLASGDRRDTFWVWDLVSRRAIASFQGDVPNRKQAYLSFYWVDDVTLIAAASDAVYWWDVMASQLLQRVARPDEAAFFVDAAFGPGGERLAVVAQDENVYVWVQETANWEIWPAGLGSSLNHVAFSPDGRLVAATTFAGELVLWDAETAEWLASYAVARGDIAAVRFSPDVQFLAVGGWDSVIGLWGIP
jgi:hypothetical protein